MRFAAALVKARAPTAPSHRSMTRRTLRLLYRWGESTSKRKLGGAKTLQNHRSPSNLVSKVILGIKNDSIWKKSHGPRIIFGAQSFLTGILILFDAEPFFFVQKSRVAPSVGDHKPKPLSPANQNQNQHSMNGGSGRRRNLHSPRPHANRNRSWFNHSFSMGYGPHPMNQSWYGVMPPPFMGGPSPPPFLGHRGNKWAHPSSYPAGPTRFHHWSPKAALKV